MIHFLVSPAETRGVFGETPKTAVETTALPESKWIVPALKNRALNP
jgi:hypothetical protein